MDGKATTIDGLNKVCDVEHIAHRDGRPVRERTPTDSISVTRTIRARRVSVFGDVLEPGHVVIMRQGVQVRRPCDPTNDRNHHTRANRSDACLPGQIRRSREA